MRFLAKLLVLFVGATAAVNAEAVTADVSNTLEHVFVGDSKENAIHAVNLQTRKKVWSIRTRHSPDQIIAAPFAPILAYFDETASVAVFIDLRKKLESRSIPLPVRPRHVVLDTTGAKIGITDSEVGGFLLISAYSKQVLLHIPSFMPTSDVLFDPNDIDIYFSSMSTGEIGAIDTNVGSARTFRIDRDEGGRWTPPSRNVDGRFLYVADTASGAVLAINKFNMAVISVFHLQPGVIRPFTTPAGTFVYVLNPDAGIVHSYIQGTSERYSTFRLGFPADTAVVTNDDRRSLFASKHSSKIVLIDNFRRERRAQRELRSRPRALEGLPDGRTAVAALADSGEVAFIDLETGSIEYVPTTEGGAKSMAIALNNNVCH